MGRNIQRSFGGFEFLDDPETWLIDSTLWFLGVFQSDANLVTELRAFVFLEIKFCLGEIVLEEVKETRVIVFRDSRVVEDESTVNDQRVCSLVTRG